MTTQQINDVNHGLYIIYWTDDQGGGSSLASVGSDRSGKRWFAPTNWVSGSTPMEEHSTSIKSVRLLYRNH